MGEIIDIGTDLKVLEKSGAWYSYDGRRLGQGKEKVRDLLAENPDLAKEIEGKIRELKGVHISSISAVDDEMPDMDQAEDSDAPVMPPVPEDTPADVICNFIISTNFEPALDHDVSCAGFAARWKYSLKKRIWNPLKLRR